MDVKHIKDMFSKGAMVFLYLDESMENGFQDESVKFWIEFKNKEYEEVCRKYAPRTDI